MTLHVPYDYVKSTEEEMDEIHRLFNSILSGESLKCYLSILRSGMIGNSYEYFIMLNGSGGNGKGLSMDLYASMCGDYCYKGKTSTLLNEIKGGADPELANMNKKRCVRFAEVPENAVLNMGTIIRLVTLSSILSLMVGFLLHSKMIVFSSFTFVSLL